MSLPGPFGGQVLIPALAVAGLGFTLLELGKGVSTMETQHYVMLFVILVAGYMLGRLWTAPAQMLGLP